MILKKEEKIINVINLPRRTDRMDLFDKESKAQGFEYRRWDGIEDMPILKGIQRAHKSIVQFAMDTNLDRVFIAEDDCRFTATGAFDYFVSQIKPDADFSCGLIYAGDVGENGRILNGMSGTHTLYCLPAKFYSFILEQPDNVHCDRNLGNYAHKYKFYVCLPYVCIQSGGFSDHLLKNMNYSAYLTDKKLYGVD